MLDFGVPIGRHDEHDQVIQTLEIPTSLPEAVLPVPNPTQSFWLDIGNDPQFDLAKTGSTGPLSPEADICIIGSGSSGISAVYHLSKLLKDCGNPTSITLLEAREFCRLQFCPTDLVAETL